MVKVAKAKADSSVRTPSKPKQGKIVKASPLSSSDAEMPKAAKKTGKVRGEKKKKDPKAPKRGLSAYMFFANDNRDKVREEHDNNISFGQVGKVLGEKWKNLSDKDKQKYKDMAETDKKRYEDEKAAYMAGGGSDVEEEGSD